MKYYLAIDIGASSGRGIIGYKEDGEIKSEEVYRFKNGVREINGSLVWAVDELYSSILLTIKAALEKYPKIESMSIDTWGVDYVLLDKNDKEIYPVYSYRDQRTKSIIDEVHSIIPFDKLYSITGSQFQEFNTIYQLYKDKVDGRLKNAKTFLQIPAYLLYKLTGIKTHEYTNASTTGMLDGKTFDYSKEIIDKLGFDKDLFLELKKPGYVLGDFKEDVKEFVGGNIKVVLCSTHDTAAAVEGMPIKENVPYISSGTWSLLGIKTANTIMNQTAQKANYSNEYGKNYIRFQKNIMGLWISQNLSKETGVGHIEMAEKANRSLYDQIFDVNDNRFLSTLNMKEEIISYYKERNIDTPSCDDDIFRTTYRSLAYSYKKALDEMEEIIGTKFDSIYIVGGGSQNKFLNKVTEEITKRKVIPGVVEATSLGNLISQMEDL